jgi:hypothetical protein
MTRRRQFYAEHPECKTFFGLRKKLYLRPVPTWLANLESLDVLPIDDLLRDSIYYPASYCDMSVIEMFGGYGHSFIYVDLCMNKAFFNEQINQQFKGYKKLFDREVKQSELCFRPYSQILPVKDEDGDLEKYHFKTGNGEESAAFWVVYERRDSIDPGYGPKRFSLLYIAGEGVATYQALYYSNKTKPSLIVMISCNTGTGGNWTEFLKRGGFFERVVLGNPAGHPDYITAFETKYGQQIWNGYSTYVITRGQLLHTWKADDVIDENVTENGHVINKNKQLAV